MESILVAYFSATGTTKRAALALADYLGADTFEIVPEVPYSSADLNWNDRQSRSSKEMDDEDSRPSIIGQVDDMGAYETIYVGFPIWWYVAPTIVSTFLEAYDFAGKTVVPFATSGGSGMGRTEDVLKACCAPETRWLPGRRMSSRASEAEVRRWVEGLGL